MEWYLIVPSRDGNKVAAWMPGDTSYPKRSFSRRGECCDSAASKGHDHYLVLKILVRVVPEKLLSIPQGVHPILRDDSQKVTGRLRTVRAWEPGNAIDITDINI